MKNVKKSGVGQKRGPTINKRQGDYNGNKIISNRQSKHNPTGNVTTVRVYQVPKTIKQESDFGSSINL